jgi:hypothetical protein
MYGQRTYITARELQGLHGKAIGGENHITRIQGKACCVNPNIEAVVCKVPGKYFLDEFPHVAATVTMCQCDVSVLHGFYLLLYA